MHQIWPRRAADPYHVLALLSLLYGEAPASGQPITRIIPAKVDRDFEIYQRYQAGGRVADLAEAFGVSVQRIYVVIRRQKNGGV